MNSESKVLKQIDQKNISLDWINLDYLPHSKGRKTEIYLLSEDNPAEGLILMFYSLFKDITDEFKIYNRHWWDFCLETWNFEDDTNDYGLEGKTKESQDYLKMLMDSQIDQEYAGICKCEDWNYFLKIVLKCVLTHQAPYSPIIYSEQSELFFYFHHTGSIGLFYKTENKMVQHILKVAAEDYDCVS